MLCSVHRKQCVVSYSSLFLIIQYTFIIWEAFLVIRSQFYWNKTSININIKGKNKVETYSGYAKPISTHAVVHVLVKQLKHVTCYSPVTRQWRLFKSKTVYTLWSWQSSPAVHLIIISQHAIPKRYMVIYGITIIFSFHVWLDSHTFVSFFFRILGLSNRNQSTAKRKY